MKSINKNRGGFTLIELIVVIVIIGILVLLATPKFLNYIEEAKLTNIIHDTKVVENMTTAHLVKFNGELPVEKTDLPIDKDELMEKIKNKKVYSKGGLLLEASDGVIYAEENTTETHYNPKMDLDFYLLDKAMVKEKVRTRLKGNFIVNTDGEALYLDEIDKNQGPGEEPEEPKEPEEIEECQYDDPFKVFRFRKIRYGFNDYHLAIVGFTDEYLECIEDREKFITIPEYVYSSEEVIEELEDYDGEVIYSIEMPIEVKSNSRKDEERHYAVVKIGDEAFYNEGKGYNIRGLRFAKKGENNRYLKEIGVRAFANNNISGYIVSPRKMTYYPMVPNTVEIVGEESFKNNDLETMRFEADGDGISNRGLVIDKRAFIGNRIERTGTSESLSGVYVSFPNRLIKIGEEAFFENKLSGKFISPKEIVSIERAAFANNEIREMSLIGSRKLKVIGEDAFKNNKIGDKNNNYLLDLPKELLEIKNGAFSMNDGLKRVRIHHGLNHEGVKIESNSIINNVEENLIPTGLGFKDVYDSSVRVVDIPGIMIRNSNDSWGYKYDIPEYIFTFSEAVDGKVDITGFTDEYLEKIKTTDDNGNTIYNAGYVRIVGKYETIQGDKHIVYDVENIADNAFYNNGLGYGITGMTSGSGLKEIGKNAFRNNQMDTLPHFTSLKKIGDYAFSGNGLKSIQLLTPNLGSVIREIGEGAFDNNDLNPKLVMPTSLRKIGDNAFRNNPRLNYVSISKNLEGLNNATFPGLDFKDVYDQVDKRMTLVRDEENSVELGHWELLIIEEEEEEEEIEKYSYKFNKSNRTAIITGYSKEYLDHLEEEGNLDMKKVFSHKQNKEHDGVSYKIVGVGDEAFYNNGKGYNISYMEHFYISSIGNRAFANNSIRGSAYLGNLKEIGKEAFANIDGQGDNKLTYASLGGNQTIGERAFEGNDLTEIRMYGNNIIKDEAFRNNPRLRKVEIGANVDIRDSKTTKAFPGLDFKEIYDGDENKESSKIMFRDKYVDVENGNWTIYVPAIVDPIEPEIIITDMFIYRKSYWGRELTLLSFNPDYIRGKEQKEKTVYIPANVVVMDDEGYEERYTVTRIEDGAFYNNGEGYNIVRAEIPYAIGTIGKSSFEGNNITSLALGGRSNRIIDERAFANNKIQYLVLPEKTKIKNEAFRYNNLSSLVLRNNVELESKAFYDNDLKTVTAENRLTLKRDSIPGKNFYEAYVSRTNVYNTILIRDGQRSNTEGIWTEPIIIDGKEDEDYTGGKFLFNNFKDGKVDILGFKESYIESIGSSIELIVPKYVVMKTDKDGNIIQSGNFDQGDIYEVANIVDSAFSNNRYNIVKLTMAESVEVVGKSAFENNDIKSVEFGESINTIGEKAFKDNLNLKIVRLNSNTEIQENAFDENERFIEILNKKELHDNKNLMFIARNLNGGRDVGAKSWYVAVEGYYTGKTITSRDYPIYSDGKYEFYTDYYNGSQYAARLIGFADDYEPRESENLVVPGAVILRDLRDEVYFTSHINSEAFYNREEDKGMNIDSLILPDSLLTIESRAFKGNNIESVDITNRIRSIGEGAFEGNNISTLNLGISLNKIFANAFTNNSLKNIKFESSLRTIDENAFRNNPDLETISINKSVSIFNNEVFPGMDFKDVYNRNISDERMLFARENIDLSSIDEKIESGNWEPGYEIMEEGKDLIAGMFRVKLNTINKTASILGFREGVFEYNISIPKNLYYEDEVYKVNTIEDNAFKVDIENKNKLKFVGFSSTVESIGKSAFENNNFTEIDFNNISEIGDRAFAGSEKLKIIKVKSNIEIGEDSFHENEQVKYTLKNKRFHGNKEDIFIARDLRAGREVGSNNWYVAVEGYDTGKTITSRNYRIYSNGKYEFYTDYYNGYNHASRIIGFADDYEPKESENLVIPGAVILREARDDVYFTSHINSEAFYNREEDKGMNIDSLILPDSLLTIESRAFKGNNIEKLNTEKRTTYIYESAFEDNNIRELEMGELLYEIGPNAFGGNNLSSLDFTDMIGEIDSEAFRDNPNLERVSISKRYNGYIVNIYNNNTFPGLDFKDIYNNNVQNEKLTLVRENIDKTTDQTKIETGNWLVGYEGIEVGDLVEAGMFKFKIDKTNKTAMVLGFKDGVFLDTVNIPKNIFVSGEEYLVRDIAENAFNSSVNHGEKIKKVTFSETVKTIGKLAFENNNFIEIDFNNISEIGDRAFAGSEKLKIIKVKSNIEIGEDSFHRNEQVKYTLKNKRFHGNKEDIFIARNLNAGREVGAKNWYVAVEGYYTGKTITSRDYPIYSDGKYEFYTDYYNGSQYAARLIGFADDYEPRESENLVVPGAVILRNKWDDIYFTSHINSEAFYDREEDKGMNIDSLILPDSLLTIESRAFKGNNIEKLNTEKRTTYIYESAFEDNNIRELEMGELLYEIGPNAFGGNDLSSLDFTDMIGEIDSEAFRDNPNLERVSISKRYNGYIVNIYNNNTFPGLDFKDIYNNNVQNEKLTLVRENIDTTTDQTKIETGNWLVGYEGIEVGDLVEAGMFKFKIDKTDKTAMVLGFKDGVFLDTVNIPKNIFVSGEKYLVRDIVENAFNSSVNHGEKIKKVTFSETVKTIGKSAFENNNFKEIDFNNISEIGDRAFFNNEKLKIIKVKSDLEIGTDSFDSNESIKKSLEEKIFHENKETIYIARNLSAGREEGSKDWYVAIEVYDIGAMNGGRNSFKYTDGRLKFDSEYYNGSNKGARLLGFYEEYEVKSSEDLVIPGAVILRDLMDGVQFTSQVGSEAFYNKEEDKGMNIDSVVLPDSLLTTKYYDTIEARAFKGNNLESLDIPKRLPYIGESAFEDNNIRELKMGEALYEIKSNAFSGNDLSSLDFTDRIGKIHPKAFRDNPNLETVSISKRHNGNIVNVYDNNTFPGLDFKDVYDTNIQNERINLVRENIDKATDESKVETGNWIIKSVKDQDEKVINDEKDIVETKQNNNNVAINNSEITDENEDKYKDMDIIEKTIRKTADKIKSIFK